MPAYRFVLFDQGGYRPGGHAHGWRSAAAIEPILAALRSAGFNNSAAVRNYRALADLVLGSL